MALLSAARQPILSVESATSEGHPMLMASTALLARASPLAPARGGIVPTDQNGAVLTLSGRQGRADCRCRSQRIGDLAAVVAQLGTPRASENQTAYLKPPRLICALDNISHCNRHVRFGS